MQEVLLHVRRLSKLIEKEPRVAKYNLQNPGMTALLCLIFHVATTCMHKCSRGNTSICGMRRTLAGLDLSQACREVIDKDANAVLDEVEAAIYIVASTILRGEGFSYDVPSRAKGNQVEPLYTPGTARVLKPHLQPVGNYWKAGLSCSVCA